MLRSVLLLSAMTSLSGCVGVVLYGASRGEVNTVVAKVLADQHPELDNAGATRCVVKAMSVKEVVVMANNNIEPITPGDISTVDQVLRRPAVAACVNALPKPVAVKPAGVRRAK